MPFIPYVSFTNKRHPLICLFWSVTLTTTWQELCFATTTTTTKIHIDSVTHLIRLKLLMNPQKRRNKEASDW